MGKAGQLIEHTNEKSLLLFLVQAFLFQFFKLDSRRRPAGSGGQSGSDGYWGSSCAMIDCKPGFASLAGTGDTNCRYCGSTRYPNNCEGKSRMGSGKNVASCGYLAERTKLQRCGPERPIHWFA